MQSRSTCANTALGNYAVPDEPQLQPRLGASQVHSPQPAPWDRCDAHQMDLGKKIVMRSFDRVERARLPLQNAACEPPSATSGVSALDCIPSLFRLSFSFFLFFFLLLLPLLRIANPLAYYLCQSKSSSCHAFFLPSLNTFGSHTPKPKQNQGGGPPAHARACEGQSVDHPTPRQERKKKSTHGRRQPHARA